MHILDLTPRALTGELSYKADIDFIKHTVNVVIFAGGKFRKKFWQHFSGRGNFHDATPISLIKAYRFYFHMGVYDFCEEDNSVKNAKYYPHAKMSMFTVIKCTFCTCIYQVTDILHKHLIHTAGHYLRLSAHICK